MVANGRRRAAPKRSDGSLAAGQTDAAQAAAGTLSVGRHDRHGVAVLSAHGELDLGTAPALREALLPVLEHEPGPVVVDLSEVTFMDSTGVHLLADTRRCLEPQQRRFAVVCPEGGPVHRVLALVGLLDLVTAYRSRESAVIGGDDVLQSEPGSDRWPSHA